ncbi:hypothetical protein WJX81_000366 [Elliptochloris bilobata]|uniref:Oxidoreductase-like domain-containing protein n=1 Tax=Elliptochloris bilobata TaxID=381761 RepID=A0AAW1QMG6_9CHLO
MGASSGDQHQSSDVEMDIDSLSAGLARVLLKGDVYTPPERTQCVELLEDWAWKSNHGIETTRYLDASCLLFGADKKFLEVVDFDRRRSSEKVGVRGAVVHSGDMLRHSVCEGVHTITVELTSLSPAVRELFITMSAYCGRLKDILRPKVRLKDPASGETLCQYEMEEQPNEERERCSSVIMCRVFRQESGPKAGNWEVEAIGHMGQGDANDYGPIIYFIQETQRMADVMASWSMNVGKSLGDLGIWQFCKRASAETWLRSLSSSAADPTLNAEPPVKPVEPGPEDCCQNSCVECVWNVYWRELKEYERALAAWEGRTPPAPATDPFEEMERRLEQEDEQRRAEAAQQLRPAKPMRPKVSHTGESYLVR